jgi:large subunit ribosomal protein L18
MGKTTTRQRRATKTRAVIRQQRAVRLCVNRTPKHMYAQVISPNGATVLVSASTLEKSISDAVSSSGNIEAAAHIGKVVAERAVAAGISKVAFDRSGFKYHGRVKALAVAAREHGLKF